MARKIVTGIDIGRHSIKAVSLKKEAGRYLVVAAITVPAPETLFVSGHTPQSEAGIAALKRVKKSLPLLGRKVAFSLPDSAVIAKQVPLSGYVDEDELEYAVYHAFSRHSPVSAEELSVDYLPTDNAEPGSELSRFQVYAARKEIVDSYRLIARKAGIELILANIQSQSLFALWQKAQRRYQRSDNWLLVDIGYSRTLVCSGKAEGFCRELACGTKALGEDSGESERENFYAQISQQLKRQVQLYRTRLLASEQTDQDAFAGSQISLLISGGGARLNGIAEYLAAELFLPCEVLQPAELFEASPALPWQEDSCHYAGALGLAVRGCEWREAENSGVNLLPWRELGRTKRRQRFSLAVALTLLLSVALTGAAQLFLQQQIALQQERNRQLQSAVQQMDLRGDEMRISEELQHSLSERLATVLTLQAEKNTATRLMSLLPEVIPGGVYLKKVAMHGFRVEIEGNGRSMSDLAAMLERLESCTALSELNMHSVKLGEPEDTGVVKQFHLSFLLNAAERDQAERAKGVPGR